MSSSLVYRYISHIIKIYKLQGTPIKRYSFIRNKKYIVKNVIKRLPIKNLIVFFWKQSTLPFWTLEKAFKLANTEMADI